MVNDWQAFEFFSHRLVIVHISHFSINLTCSQPFNVLHLINLDSLQLLLCFGLYSSHVIITFEGLKMFVGLSFDRFVQAAYF